MCSETIPRVVCGHSNVFTNVLKLRNTKNLQNVFFLLIFAQNLVVSLDCIPDTEKTRNPGFLDQEILVSGFFLDQDLRNQNSRIPAKFERCSTSSHHFRAENVFWRILVDFWRYAISEISSFWRLRGSLELDISMTRSRIDLVFFLISSK